MKSHFRARLTRRRSIAARPHTLIARNDVPLPRSVEASVPCRVSDGFSSASDGAPFTHPQIHRRRVAAQPSSGSSAVMRRTRALCVVVALAAVSAARADAGPWAWSLNGLADIRAHGSEDNATRLVPEPERIGLEPRFFSVTAVGGLQAWKGPVTVSGAGRLSAQSAPREGDRWRFSVDELHVEYAATPEHFLFAGRRHIVHGRSLGVNPLDVALDPSDLDRSKNATRRRSETEGQDMLGFESLLDDRFTLTGYWTPGERTLLAGTFTLPEWKSDLAALVFDDDHPGAGLSFSQTLGEAVLAYADVAVRRGRDRMVIRADRGSDAGPGAFITEKGDDSRLFAQASLGIGYTLDSGATFNLEYHFDANGYSTGEWDEITSLIVENDTMRADRRFGELPIGNLLRLSAQLDRFTLRRHYGFFRAQYPDLFGHDLEAEMSVFHNLTDHSGSLGLRLERGMGPNLLLGIEGRYLYGDDLDEFGLRTARLSGSVHVTVHF